MPLRAWYLLNGNVANKGTGDFPLTQVTSPTWAAGKIAAQSLNSGAYKWTPEQTASVMNNEAFSYAAWIYVGESDTRSMIFGYDLTPRRFCLFQYPTKNDFHYSWATTDSGNNMAGLVTGALPTGQWTHIAAVYKKGHAWFYINGVLRASETPTINITSYNVQTTVIHNNANHRLQDIRIYDHALSQKEVAELAKGMIHHFPMYAGYPGINTNMCPGWYSMRKFTVGQYYTILMSDTNFFGLQVGDTFTYRVKLIAPSTKGIRARIQYYNSSSDRTGPTSSVTVSSGATGYSYITETMTAAKRAYSRMDLMITSADNTVTTNDPVYVGEVKLELGSTATPWCDGEYGNDYTVKDCSGHQNYVKSVGNVIPTNSDGPRYNSSARIANGSYIEYTMPTGISHGTMAFWVKPSSGGPYSSVDIIKNNPTGGLWLAINTENSKLWAFWNSTYNKVSGSLTANTWYHVAMTFNAGVTQWYLNGDAVGSAVDFSSTGTTWPAGTRTIGNSYTGSTWDTTFNGSISDWRFYGTVLTAAQIKELYNTPASIANTGACVADEFAEGASGISVTKTGIVNCSSISSMPVKYDNTVLIEPDGTCWAHLLHHADPTTYKFASSDPFATGVWKDSRRYLDASLCDKVDKWEFLLVQKADSSATTYRFRWKQNVNPNTATYANVAAANVTKKGSTDGYTNIITAYGGIYKLNSSTFYCANNTHEGNWWGALGAWSAHNGGIPGFNDIVVKDGGFQDLYIRIDNVVWNTELNKCSFDKGGKGVISPEFVEQ